MTVEELMGLLEDCPPKARVVYSKDGFPLDITMTNPALITEFISHVGCMHCTGETKLCYVDSFDVQSDLPIEQVIQIL